MVWQTKLLVRQRRHATCSANFGNTKFLRAHSCRIRGASLRAQNLYLPVFACAKQLIWQK